MSKNKYPDDRLDFWNVPCNPITGFKLTANNGLEFTEQKDDFFKPIKLSNFR